MAHSRWAATAWLLSMLALVFNFNSAIVLRAAPTVWSGATTTFTKTGTDPTDTSDPLNQDRLTGNVWLTRGGDQGMFNIAPGHEASYVRYTSPADTQWATSVMSANTGKTIAAANWAQLSFTDWAPSYGGPGFTLGSNITTHNAVVHLLTDDIYLDLIFTGFTSGGDFTYNRSTPAAAGPTGDYNHNGVVDAGDYGLWRKTPASFGGDPGGYNTWRANFGNAPGSGSLAVGAVPEPATIALQLGLPFALTWRVRKRLAD